MHTRAIIQDALYYTIGALGARSIAAVPFIYFYKVYGWSGAGTWSLTLTTATALALLYSAGIRQQMTRAYAKKPTQDTLQEYFGYSVWCTSVGTIGTFIVSRSASLTLLAASSSVWETFIHQFRCTLQAPLVTRYTLYNALGSTGIVLILFFFNIWSVLAYAVAYTAFLCAILQYFCALPKISLLKRAILTNITGYPHALFLLLPWIMGYIDRAILAQYSLELVGKYALYDLVTQLYQLGLAAPIINSIKIRVFTQWSSTEQAQSNITSISKNFIKIVIISLIVSALLISYFLRHIHPILFLLMPTITALLGTLVYASSWRLQFAQQSFALSMFACATCMLKTVLTLILVPYRDIMGCFFASSLTYSIIIGVLWSKSHVYAPVSSA